MNENVNSPNDIEKHSSVPEKEQEVPISGTVKIYFSKSKSGSVRAQINIKENVASRIESLFRQGEELYLTFDEKTRTLKIEPFPTAFKK